MMYFNYLKLLDVITTQKLRSKVMLLYSAVEARKTMNMLKVGEKTGSSSYRKI